MRKQKFLAMLLALAMLLPMLPMFTMETSAAEVIDDNADVIRLPITIRDANEDQVLFQGTKIDRTRTGNYGNYKYTNMVTNSLSGGIPQYTETVITKVAGYLTFERSYDGSYNNNNVKNDYLLSVLKNGYENNPSGWNTTTSADGGDVVYLEDATNAYEAAKWLLEHLFVDGQYKEGVTAATAQNYFTATYPGYETLVLKPTTRNGEKCYYYDSAEKTIFHHSSTTDTNINQIYNDASGKTPSSGGWFPLDSTNTSSSNDNGLGFGEITGPGDNRNDYHNYFTTTAGSGQFVYHEEDELFFEFNGDDDVFLYINGKLVIDNSGIHTKEVSRIDLESKVKSTANSNFMNEDYDQTGVTDNTTWAEYLGLQEGEIYSFNFFQMERNRTSSNFAMWTNIKVVDSSAVPQKKAYLNGQELTYGAFVPQQSDITYGFVLTNNGTGAINNLKFVDNLLGVDLHSVSTSENPAPVSLGTAEYKDLEYAVYETSKGAPSSYNKLTNETGAAVLDTLLSQVDDLDQDGDLDGLLPGWSIEIRGFKYNVGVPAQGATTKTITNTVYTTATGPSRNDPTQTVEINGSATMRVRTLQVENVSFVMDYAKSFTLLNADVFKNELAALNATIEVKDEIDGTVSTVTLTDKVNQDNVRLKNTIGQYGTMAMQADNTITTHPAYDFTYTPTRFLSGVDTYLIEIDITSITQIGNTTESSQYSVNKAINIIPANNVYYEDSFVTNESTGVIGINFSDEFWTTVGTEAQNGEHAENYENKTNGGVHGWEDALADDKTYSDGSAHKGTVGATANFTFTGTGVDVYSFTDLTTAIVTAKIERLDGTGTYKKYLMVDNLAVSGQYYQVPTLSFCNLDYGTYRVTLGVDRAKAVESIDQENKEIVYSDEVYRGTYYLDGIRIYNPLGEDETDATFTNVNQLIESQDAVFTDIFEGEIEARVYANSTTYQTYGPKNEVYLAKGEAVTFSVVGGSEYYVGMKALDGSVATVVEVTNNDGKTPYNISHTTDLYYKVVPTYDAQSNKNLVTIQNTGDGILSLTKIQIIAATDTSAVSFMAVSEDEAVNYVATFASRRVIEEVEEPKEDVIPEVTPEEEQPEVPEIEVEIENEKPVQKPVENTILKNLVKNLFSKIFGWFGR